VEEVAEGVVTLTETTGDRDGEPLRVDRASLRFVGPEDLDVFLAEAEIAVEARYGGWRGEALDDASLEIVTVARTARC
jgi:hypothetical protein